MQTETQYLQTDAARYAWRRLGAAAGVPLVLIQRFGGTMDDWDPELLDRLAAGRTVLLFDNAGIGRSSGETASNFTGIAGAAAAFLDGLGLRTVDVLGWSMGGYVASHLALERPDLVRRLILASSGPGHVTSAPEIPAAPQRPGGGPADSDADYLYLNFPDTPAGRAGGASHLARLKALPGRFKEAPDAHSAAAQLAARQIVMTPEGSLLGRFASLSQPTLVAGGLHDVRIPIFYAFAAAQALPHAKLIIYPDAGHGFLFQLAHEFARDALQFLDS
jgi:pimeloyl-ACP methyl ester carboxylesterase